MFIMYLKKEPSYNYTDTLEDNLYQFTVNWNTYNQCWYLDLLSLSDDVNIDIKGMKLLPNINILGQYGLENNLGYLTIYDNKEQSDNPDYDNIGDRYQLIYLSISDMKELGL